ncbi:MAG: hypothetical protein SFX73_02935 [Kofleriaceae bacterium]|nr:hypothetical protein [Kofleriaceae bacterium]
MTIRMLAGGASAMPGARDAVSRSMGATVHDATPLLDSKFTLGAGNVLAGLLALISLAGLLDPASYARETESWRAQALAQDWFDLVIAAPALALATWASARGARRGLLVLAGAALFTTYTLAIYAFAIHLNRWFLLYCAGFGAALWLLIAVARRLFAQPGHELERRLPRRAAGGYLVALGAAFALLWLAQLVPAALDGSIPADLAATGLMTNPVHVIDLAFILPLHVVAGLALWWRRPHGFTLATTVLVFGALMAASIALLALRTGGVPIAVAMVALAALSALLGWRLLRT